MTSRFHQRVWEATRVLLLQALAEAGGNVSEAARQMGVHRNTIDRMLKQHQIDAEQFRKNFERAKRGAEMAVVEKTRKERIAQYANTYCQGLVEGGLTGTRICGTAIPIDERYCLDCKARQEDAKKPATNSVAGDSRAQK